MSGKKWEYSLNVDVHAPCNMYYLTMRGGSVDEPRPRRQSHVVGSQNWTIGPAILFEVSRKRVAVTQSG